MLFNSIEFVLFLPVVFLLYWLVLSKHLRLQNLLIVASSYVFYGWWDWRFLSLIIFSSFVDYFVGLALHNAQTDRRRRLLLYLSLMVNLGLLGFFKYYNFFVDSFIDAFATLGVHLEASTLNIVLPVGISFYTFQTLSYSIDIYRRKLEPTKDMVAFFAFVCFFPQLVAGPIERATKLLPQFQVPRQFKLPLAKDGLRQMLWGLFKKVVIADNCAVYVNDVFANYDTLPSSALILATILFAFQIYCDFSGYSDIAIGTARLFGFELMRNFAYPYFARDIAEFWRRWHISLSTWFRDYLYIPLGGSRVEQQWKIVRNVMIIFIVSGFWHGANWTFLVWGALNGLYFLPLLLSKRNRRYLDDINPNSWLPTFRELSGILTTFALTCFAWIFFRAENLNHALRFIAQMVTEAQTIIVLPTFSIAIPFILLLLVVEWRQRALAHPLMIAHLPTWQRWTTYYILIFLVLYFKPAVAVDFIYFQF